MMTTLVLAAAMLLQTKPAETLKPKPPQKAEEVKEDPKITAAAEAAYGVAGRGPLTPVTINAELSVRPVGVDTWVVVHAVPWAANSLLARMPDGTLVLVDTPYDDLATKQLLAWIHTTFGEVKLVAVNSHFHADALGGNGALRAAGAVSYGSKLTAQMLKERGAKNKEGLLGQVADQPELQGRFKAAAWLPPAEQFETEKGLELTFGGEKLQLFYPGPGHSPDNIVAWFPGRKLLFGGCLVRAGSGIPNLADADLDAWPEAIEKLRRFEARTIVPGHGRVGGPELLDHTIAVIAEHRKKE